MKNLKFASFLLVVVFSCLSFAPSVYGGDREIGGYVDLAEDRFVRNVWNFIKNFQGFKNIGRTSSSRREEADRLGRNKTRPNGRIPNAS